MKKMAYHNLQKKRFQRAWCTLKRHPAQVHLFQTIIPFKFNSENFLIYNHVNGENPQETVHQT